MEHLLEWFFCCFLILALNNILKNCRTHKINDTIVRNSNREPTLIMGSCLGNFTATDNNANEGITTPTTPTTTCSWGRPSDGQDVELISNVNEKYVKRQNIIYRIFKFKNKQNKGSKFLDAFWQNSNLPNYDELTGSNGNDSFAGIQMENLDVHNLIQTVTYAKESTMNFIPSHTGATSRASSSLDLEWEHEYGNMRHSFIHNHSTAIRNGQYNNQLRPPISGDYRVNAHSMNERDTWQQFLNSGGDENHSETSEANTQSFQLLNAMASAYLQTTRSERRHTKPSSRFNSVVASTGGSGSFTRNSSHNNSWSHISTPESLEWDIDEEQQQQLHEEDDNLDHETLQLLYQIEQLKNRVLDETGDGLLGSRQNSNLCDIGGEIEFRVKYPSS